MPIEFVPKFVSLLSNGLHISEEKMNGGFEGEYDERDKKLA